MSPKAAWLIDARRLVFVCNPLPTLRVCMQCGAHWQQEHVGPHDRNRREYRRASPWPRPSAGA